MKKIWIVALCLVLIAASWLLILTSGTDRSRQKELMEQAQPFLEDEVYIKAQPLLEEAAQYQTSETSGIKKQLLDIYEILGDTTRYVNLTEELLAQDNAEESQFTRAADYYFVHGAYQDALRVLSDGAQKTGSNALLQRYEENRYACRLVYGRYEKLSAILGGSAVAMREGAYGVVKTDGTTVLPFAFDALTNFTGGSAVVLHDGKVYAVNSKNQRLALLHPQEGEKQPTGLSFQSENRLAVQFDNSYWRLSTPGLNTGPRQYQNIGIFSEGYVAIQTDGLWGVMDVEGNYLLEPLYEDIARDELGRCYGAQRVFAKEGGLYYLYGPEGRISAQGYEDAQPFADGYAAVQKGGKWGFIDTKGEEVLPFEWDDAKSFGMHLASVQTGGKWGYISLAGQLVIEPQFIDAKSFSSGCAPVCLDSGWTFLVLDEYR